ncbi:MAG TPA: HD domain-containing protein [Anaerolineales bacterium]|nr:HD domain-containing protein [Anaerolineales bacterium]
MIASHRHPDPETARTYLRDAETRNPGAWIAHSQNVAVAARAFAERIPDLDPERAEVFGLLHDIGRRVGVIGMRHVYDGYRFMLAEGWHSVARICLTHSFPYQDVRAASSRWDCTPEELDEIERYLSAIEYDRYDELIQLCDSIAVPEGFCLLEKRLVDVMLRYKNFNDFTLLKWEAFFAIKERFEARMGVPIYNLLPGVVETTFS